ncbi:uncharacterized protein G2W53_002887 [Senna tora]|uniref:Uncharacterized protein n=1 Tax=Senna tora TaxID=362788 RepID=A0A834XAN3_9FABA|nr:uncharacterized protein G2W53_002887 [Senna tora]
MKNNTLKLLSIAFFSTRGLTQPPSSSPLLVVSATIVTFLLAHPVGSFISAFAFPHLSNVFFSDHSCIIIPSELPNFLV